MWTKEHRERYHCKKRGLRYPSDVTDAEWMILKDLIPPARPGGRPRTTDMREVVNAIFYLLRTGCGWQYLPTDFPPWQTVYDYFAAWGRDGTWGTINHALVMQTREQGGRDASPSAGIIDCQSAKSAERGGRRIDPVGSDAGKKVKGRKRHVVVDTSGNLLKTLVLPADIQERDGARLLLNDLKGLYVWLQKLWADAAYRGKNFANQIRKATNILIEVVKRAETATGFVVLARRWVVERTLAWLNRNRRLSKDYENLAETTTYYLYCASIQLMSRRLTFNF